MTYDVKKVTVIVDGRYLTGFSSDTKVGAERNEDTQIEYIGVEGDVEYSKNANKSGTITVPLKSTSPSIKYLNGLANAQKEFGISVVDMNSNGINATGVNAVVRRPIFPERGKEIGEAEFEIFVGDLTIS